MPEGFVHSVKVPRLYKTAASTVKNIVERKASLKELVYERKHPNVKAIYALAATTLQHSSQLTELLEKTELLKKEPRLDQWLARILITELIWGKQSLQSEAKPILTIKNYENKLRDALKNTRNTQLEKSIKKVEKPRYVRVNTLIMSVDNAIQELKNDGFTLLPKSKNYKSYLKSLESLDTWSFIQDYHVRELFAFKAGTTFYDHDGYKSGALVLQDKASCLPAHLLNPPPGSGVLDMCAAPGMKTTHLAAILNNKGKIYSIERDERRYQVLCDFIKSSGANIVTTVNADALTINSDKYPGIEYILVDPTCSGSGMDRPEIDESTNKSDPSRLKSLQSFQVFLLRHALFNFPAARRIVYSTCSIYPEENEMVVDEILNDIGNAYKLVPVKEMFNNEWINYSSEKFNCKDNCLYAKPSVDYSNGFFVAVFERNFEVPLPEFKKIKAGLKDEQGDEKNDGKLNNQRKKRKKKNKVMDSEQGTEIKKSVVNGNNEGKGKKRKMKKIKLLSDDKLTINNGVQEVKKSLIEEAKNINLNEEKGEENSEKVDTKKKRKKEKLLTEEINDVEKTELNGEEISEETDTKKKRKKKKLLTGEVNNIEKNELNGEEVSEESNVKKKKKKKSLTEEVNEIEKNELNDEEIFVEADTKKKKKKKKLLTEDEVRDKEKNEEINEKVDKKKKKKLPRDEKQSEMNDEKKTERLERKKRKYDSVDDNNSTANDDSNGNITKKKKKKVS